MDSGEKCNSYEYLTPKWSSCRHAVIECAISVEGFCLSRLIGDQRVPVAPMRKPPRGCLIGGNRLRWTRTRSSWRSHAIQHNPHPKGTERWAKCAQQKAQKKKNKLAQSTDGKVGVTDLRRGECRMCRMCGAYLAGLEGGQGVAHVDEVWCVAGGGIKGLFVCRRAQVKVLAGRAVLHSFGHLRCPPPKKKPKSIPNSAREVELYQHNIRCRHTIKG